MLTVVKFQNLPDCFREGFRSPSNKDHKEVVRVFIREIIRRTDIGSVRLILWVVGAFCCSYFFECERVVLSAISVVIMSITFIDIILYLAKRCFWYSILRCISYKDYSVNFAKCCMPVLNGFRSTVVAELEGKTPIVVPSLYVSTEEMLCSGELYSGALFIKIGSSNKVFVTPTCVVYEYV